MISCEQFMQISTVCALKKPLVRFFLHGGDELMHLIDCSLDGVECQFCDAHALFMRPTSSQTLLCCTLSCILKNEDEGIKKRTDNRNYLP